MTPFRLTTSTRLVLAALQEADRPVWGFDICRKTGLKSGTIYPILARLHGHGWVDAWDETDPHPGRPPRRFYQLTDRGRPEHSTEARHPPQGAAVNAWTPPPPGDTREQLPDQVLDLLPERPYLSTACETAQALEDAIAAHPGRDDLPEWRDRMHARCRINHKFTGTLCGCGCHREKQP